MRRGHDLSEDLERDVVEAGVNLASERATIRYFGGEAGRRDLELRDYL